MANNPDMLIAALDYIENNLAGNITVEDVAEHLYVSVSGLQKTFNYVFHMYVKEYIIRRRFSCAAEDLLKTDDSILSIALKYGYSSPESFTRGFRKIWDITPTEFRKHRKFSGHTPRLSPPNTNGREEKFMNGIKYDITDMYKVLQEKKNNAYVCVDLCNLMVINNEYGRKAGDAALLELMRRVESECGEDDLFLRIGGDEFVVFTGSPEMDRAAEIVKNVSAQNGQTIVVDGKEIPISLHIGAFINPKTDYHVNASEVFEKLKKNIDEIHR